MASTDPPLACRPPPTARSQTGFAWEDGTAAPSLVPGTTTTGWSHWGLKSGYSPEPNNNSTTGEFCVAAVDMRLQGYMLYNTFLGSTVADKADSTRYYTSYDFDDVI